MPSASDLATALDGLLDAARYREDEPENGLLIDTGRAVARLGAAVNTSSAAIEAAAGAGVDLLMVHHASWPYIDRHLHEPKLARQDLVDALTDAVGGEPEVSQNVDHCERVGIVTGAGGMTNWLEEALELGCDTYLTGEGSMYTRLFAHEAGINLILGGHYRTEAPGIRALAAWAAERHGLDWVFVEDEPFG